MDINNALLNNIEMYSHGRMNFIVGLCEQLNLPEVFNKNLKKTLGRNTDIPYGIMAEMMLVNICDDHHPLYRLDEYYEMKDLEGIFHHPISLSQVNDDRFGKFLDAFYEAGARRIFAELSTQAFITYEIEVTNINYDTTSKTMWGTYETEEGKEGVISIDFGHSKQKREDKKQIKIGLGVASGVIVDAKVLSGNKDDKTFNGEILEEVENTLQRLHVSKEDFHYIADSALFTSENLKKAKSKNLKLITRMPETTLVAKKCIQEALAKKDDMRKIDIINKQGKTIEYLVMEMDSTYENTNLKCAICYSKNLEEIKKKTIERQIKREKETIEKLSKSYLNSAFACEEDANKEILKLMKKDLKKVKYHTVSIDTKAIEKRSRGRQPKDLSKIKTVVQHYLKFEIKLDEEKVQTQFEEACTFVLCSNDLSLNAEEILKEYKTQSAVEKKFQQIKSPHFVNALYVDTPKRVEALTYLILISMMLLSVSEYVVRRELKSEGEKIIGPGKVKMTQPTLRAILEIFNVGIGVKVITVNGKKQRFIARPLTDSHKKILKYLSISEDIFYWNK